MPLWNVDILDDFKCGVSVVKVWEGVLKSLSTIVIVVKVSVLLFNLLK